MTHDASVLHLFNTIGVEQTVQHDSRCQGDSFAEGIVFVGKGVKSTTMIRHVKFLQMLNLLLCKVEEGKFQTWFKMPMLFTCPTYGVAVGEGTNKK